MQLPDYVLKHSIGVAEFMAEYAKTHPDCHLDPYQCYVVGLLHDIGKLYPPDPDAGNNKYKNHSLKGADLLAEMGFHNYKDVKHHGHPETGYFSHMWLILNLADLSINGKGKKVTIRARLKSIKDRYGKFSEEYERAKKMCQILYDKGIIRENYRII